MNVYQRAVRDIVGRRRDDIDDGLDYFLSAVASDPKLRAAYNEYQEQARNSAQKLPNTLDAARKKLAKQISASGVDLNKVNPPPRCNLCNDTGYSGGGYCKCVLSLVIGSEKENLVLPVLDFAEKHKSAPAAIKKIYDKSAKYIEGFPNGDKPFYVVAGSSGTGKTVWAAAVASEIMRKGGTAVTVTAFELVKRAKDYHTQFAIEDYVDLFTPMLDADILVIDDLGTETMLKNITREYLFTIINERWMRKKYTVVTTNLTPEQMLNRYGEAIFSRICDKNSSILDKVATKNERLKQNSD